MGLIPVAVFWKAGNGLFLDLSPVYIGVCFYKGLPWHYLNLAYMFYALLYASDLGKKKKLPPKNVMMITLQKICNVEILMRFELLWMKNLIF